MLAERVRGICQGIYSDDVESLVRTLGMRPQTCDDFESGVRMPAEVVLRFIDVNAVSPRWLLRVTEWKRLNPSATRRTIFEPRRPERDRGDGPV